MSPVQNPLAERTLFIVAAGGKQIPVPVRLHHPVQHSCSWSCTYEINWPKKRKSMAIFGVDSVQALNLALQMVGSELYTSRYHAEGTLVWNTPGDGYGFPILPTLRDLLVGADRN
jgi:hypothetical protein